MNEPTSDPERLRPVEAGDDPFLFDLYASTRAAEFAVMGWDDIQLRAFLQMQFNAQRQSYQMAYPEAEHSIVEVAGRPAGRLLVDRTRAAHCLVDIALLPEHRGGGIGTRLVRTVQTRASDAAASVVLHVLHGNPARRLYERLGFRPIGDTGTHLEMEWTPGSDAGRQL